MIAFRQIDARYPFLWEGTRQPAGRWHDAGEGPAHYFADTPDGAWAEFVRHEEITEPDDLATVRRQMWVVDIGDAPAATVRLPDAVLTGGRETYRACQAEARRLRQQGAKRLTAPSAALKRGGARGMVVNHGVQLGPPKDGTVVVVFGSTDGLVGWTAADHARPPVDLLDRVHHYTSS
jgi:hypothetical protein